VRDDARAQTDVAFIERVFLSHLRQQLYLSLGLHHEWSPALNYFYCYFLVALPANQCQMSNV
jgi:hypothetical protein